MIRPFVGRSSGGGGFKWTLRDGRVVYVGNEKVDDVTTHPALRNAAQTVVALYDMKARRAKKKQGRVLGPSLLYLKCGARRKSYWQTCTRGRTQA
jgi:hypothetical protein